MFDFLWEVHSEGYQLVEVATAEDWVALGANRLSSPQWVLTDGQAWRFIVQKKKYLPLKEFTGLFRTFAETDPTESGILAFANKYGFLTKSQWEGVFFHLSPINNPEKKYISTGELLNFWTKEILEMKDALSLWDMARRNDIEGLSRHIYWEGSDRVCYQKDVNNDWIPNLYEWRVITDRYTHPGLLERLSPYDIITPALCHVQRVVNQHLYGRVSPALLWDEELLHPGLYFQPNSLIGALWLQFAQAINGNKDYRRCQQCQTWFELSPSVARSDKQYCTGSCRTRAHRDRKAKV